VIVVGCGGVGSWAATTLVRSGVGKVRFIDFDQVTLSSLNRHAVATLADVGIPKVLALRKRLEQVAPWVEIDARCELWNRQNGETLLDGNPTFVVDAIDNIDTKVDLLQFCSSRGIPVISSMGAGCKSDPTRVQLDSTKFTLLSITLLICCLFFFRSILVTYQIRLRIHSLEQQDVV
jgi:tRNA A37 threonylcarbamoyladenosine dehydratase